MKSYDPEKDDYDAVIRGLRTENERLRRALAGHLFDGESLSTREAIRSELIKQGFMCMAAFDHMVEGLEALVIEGAHHPDCSDSAIGGTCTCWVVKLTAIVETAKMEAKAN